MLKKLEKEDISIFKFMLEGENISESLYLNFLTVKEIDKLIRGVLDNTFLVYYENKPVGFIIYKKADLIRGYNLRSGFELIYGINLEYEGNGIMRKAILEFINLYKDKIDFIILKIENNNRRSINLALKLDFKLIKEEKIYSFSKRFINSNVFLLKIYWNKFIKWLKYLK